MKAGTVAARRTRPTAALQLPLAAIPENHYRAGWPPVWWVGCHGGAGTSTLARLVGFGADFGAAWPALTPAMPGAQVVLVCRASASGTWSATGAVEQWRRRAGVARMTWLLGVVAVAASPRRPPRIATERLRLLSGWAPQIWRVGWIDDLLAVDEPTDIGTPPDIEALRTTIWHTLHAKQRGRQ
ncbi:hypothetical protein ACN26Z_00405 [Verrucosispora sp. WMMD703]|uniref:hypothetical protein n=1 Tax=Verrucosispora sp. WMMD703 TaxID=3403463 RepID=UPI003B938FF4